MLYTNKPFTRPWQPGPFTRTHTCTDLAFIQGTFVRTDAPTYRTAFAYRSFYAKVSSHTKKLGRADAFAQRHCLRTDAFNQRKFWHRSFYTQVLWYREGFYTQTLLHQGALTRRIFHTQTLSGTRAFSQRKTIHKSYYNEKAPTQESFYAHTHTQEHLRTEASGTGSAQGYRKSKRFESRKCFPTDQRCVGVF